jgi:hypothetical protein
MWKKTLLQVTIAAVGAFLLWSVVMNGNGQINPNGSYKNTDWNPLATPTPSDASAPIVLTLPSGQVVPANWTGGGT